MLRVFFLILIFVLSACQTMTTFTPRQRAQKLTNRSGYFTVQQLREIRKTYAEPCKQAGFQPNSDGHDLCMAAMYYGDK